MEKQPRYNFSAEEIKVSNYYNAKFQGELDNGSSVVSAEIAAKEATLEWVVNSEENVRTSGGAFRSAKATIAWGVPHDVAHMFDEAYSDNIAFDASKTAD
jgi:hypothetical protein